MDVDTFISEIHSRPAIWDLNSDLYSHRNEKVKAWEEICELFINNFKDKSSKEKNTAGKLTFYLNTFLLCRYRVYLYSVFLPWYGSFIHKVIF